MIRSSSGERTQPLLASSSEPGRFTSSRILRKTQIRLTQSGFLGGVVSSFGLLLLVIGTESLIKGSGKIAGRAERESSKLRDATMLLSKTAGLSSLQEADMLLNALEDGTLDYDEVSAAMEAKSMRKAAKGYGPLVADVKKKVDPEKRAVDKAAADAKSFKEHTSSPDSLLKNFDDEKDEDDSFWVDSNDILDEEEEGFAFPRQEQKQDTHYQRKHSNPAFSRKENARAVVAKSRHSRKDRRSSLSDLDDEESNEYDETSRWDNGLDEYDDHGNEPSSHSRSGRYGARARGHRW